MINRIMQYLGRYELVLWVAVAYGLLGWGFSYTKGREYGAVVATDFGFPMRGALLLMDGRDPYTSVLYPDPRTVNHDPLYYPLPAVLVALPFAFVYGPVAVGLFSGLTAGLLAGALIYRGMKWRLLLFLTPFAAINGVNGQWLFLMIAGSLLPGLSWVWICKPTTGLALVLGSKYRLWGILGGMIVLGVSSAVLPGWVIGWLHNIGLTHHPIPIVYYPVFALALVRWRDPKSLLFLMLCMVPIMDWWYDLLPLTMLAGSPVMLGAWVVWSWAMFIGAEYSRHYNLMGWNIYAGYMFYFMGGIILPTLPRFVVWVGRFVRDWRCHRDSVLLVKGEGQQ